MLFYTLYINYNFKLLVGERKRAIFWDILKRLASKRGTKIAQEEKIGWNELLICICFKTKRSVVMFIINSGTCF